MHPQLREVGWPFLYVDRERQLSWHSPLSGRGCLCHPATGPCAGSHTEVPLSPRSVHVPRPVSGPGQAAPRNAAVLALCFTDGPRGGPGCAPGRGCLSWDGRLQPPEPRASHSPGTRGVFRMSSVTVVFENKITSRDDSFKTEFKSKPPCSEVGWVSDQRGEQWASTVSRFRSSAVLGRSHPATLLRALGEPGEGLSSRKLSGFRPHALLSTCFFSCRGLPRGRGGCPVLPGYLHT